MLMSTNSMNNATIYANQFVYSIIEENEPCSSGYEWKFSSDGNYDEDDELLCSNACLSLLNGDGDLVGSISYKIVRDNRCRYSYTTSFSFDSEVFDDVNLEDLFKFNKIHHKINLVEDGLYDKICAYLHRYAMIAMDSCEAQESTCPPSYYTYCSPTFIEAFVRTNRLSKYVPIDFEMIDEKGDPIKHLKVLCMGFNDEANRLFISLSE